MKLCRWGNNGREAPGIVTRDEQRLDVSGFGEDFDEAFFRSDGPTRLQRWLEKHQSDCQPLREAERWAAPVCRPSKLVCVGLNYTDHARETNSPAPKEPILFFKATTALCGPYDDLTLPADSMKTDWEVELAIVIGREAKNVPVGKGLGHVAGYALHNDYSERSYQLERGGQWVKGKSYDSFAPLGPFLATSDELSNVQELPLWLELNGERMQDGNTRDMIFPIGSIIEYVSGFMTLLPGDIISTGTPAGVGLGMTPPRFLRPGDRVTLAALGLGSSTQQVRRESEV